MKNSNFFIYALMLTTVHLSYAVTTTEQSLLSEVLLKNPESLSKSSIITNTSKLLASLKNHHGILNSVLDLNNNLQPSSEGDDCVNSIAEVDDMDTAESSVVFMPLFAYRRKVEKRKAQKRRGQSTPSTIAGKPHKTTYYYAYPYYYEPSYSSYPSYSGGYSGYPSYPNNYQGYSNYPSNYQSYPSVSNSYGSSQYPAYDPNTFNYPSNNY